MQSVAKQGQGASFRRGSSDVKEGAYERKEAQRIVSVACVCPTKATYIGTSQKEPAKMNVNNVLTIIQERKTGKGKHVK